MWPCGSISCGNPNTLLPEYTFPVFSLVWSTFSRLLEYSQELDFWVTQVLTPGSSTFYFSFWWVCARERPFIFLKTYLILWDGWVHLGGSSALSDIGWGHSGSCVQLGARPGQEHLAHQLGCLEWVGAGQAPLIAWLDFFNGSRVLRAARFPGPNYIILPRKAMSVKGMISGVMEADKDEPWEKATSWMIGRFW